MPPSPVVEALNLSKTYPGTPPVAALRGASLRVWSGERVAVLGRSGAGKSTLLNLIGLLDTPTEGFYSLLGRDTAGFRSRERDHARAHDLGFVFQASHVIAHRTVAENVLLKLVTARVPARARQELVNEVVEAVGLAHRMRALGGVLSGGERQRLAIARAVVTRPRVLLADEPTGNLDGDNASSILTLFDEQARRGAAVIVITHDDRTSRWADRVVELKDGRIGGT